MPDAEPERLRLRVSVVTASVLGVMIAIVVALLVFDIFEAARTPIVWTLAGLILTLVLLPAVDLLARWLPRVLAAALVLIVLAAAYVFVGYRFVDDLTTEVDRLKVELPQAAADLEEHSSFLRDFNFTERVTEFVEQLPSESIQVDEAASTAVTYVVSGTLTLFLLLYFPRLLEAGFKQIRDESRRRELRRFVLLATTRTQRYVLGSLAAMVGFGLVIYALCRLFDLPAPTPLAVVAGLLTALPYFGVALGGLPVLLLAAGLRSWWEVVILAAIILALQVLQVVIWKRMIQERSLYVGPAVIAIVGLLGFDLYGLGGLLFGTVVGVFLVALGDAAANTAFYSGSRPPVTTEGEPTTTREGV